MYPRRFARVRPAGKGSNSAKLIVGPKDPLLTATLSTIPPVAPASKSLGSPGCLIDLSWYLVVPRSVAGSSGAPDDVWESLFMRHVDNFAGIPEDRLSTSYDIGCHCAEIGCPAMAARMSRLPPSYRSASSDIAR